MSASLVGSEMCIRDSVVSVHTRRSGAGTRGFGACAGPRHSALRAHVAGCGGTGVQSRIEMG
eukprot:4495207-Alexandrium_andersonii.AAC.1